MVVENRIIERVGGGATTVQGVEKFNFVHYSEWEAVPVNLDEVWVVATCRCDIFSLKGWDWSGNTSSGGYETISLFDEKL